MPYCMLRAAALNEIDRERANIKRIDWWLPGSPDLNKIETLWDVLKDNKDEVVVRGAWEAAKVEVKLF